MNTVIVDSIMGSGKSSWAIEKMKDINDRYIYITPFLSEIERVKHSISNKRFYDPKNFGNGKLDSLKKLLEEGKNIASTHALFATADEEVIQLLESQGYTLILDEVMEVVNPIPASSSDIKLLKDANAVSINENNMVSWRDSYEYTNGKFDTLKAIIKNERVICVDGVYFVWIMPIDVFKCFTNIYVLTYMFDGQVMKSYFDLHEIEYSYRSVEKIDEQYSLIDHTDNKKNISHLINIYDDPNLNAVGNKHYDLSKSWYDKSPRSRLNILKNNLYNFYRNKIKAKSKEILWTTFIGIEDDNDKDYYKKLKGKGYSSPSCFAPCNCRATNEYRERRYLAYTINRFMNPYIKKYFSNHNIEIREEDFALGEMLQWIFRSAIREGKRVFIYIPSKRMRELLELWIKNEVVDNLEVDIDME